MSDTIRPAVTARAATPTRLAAMTVVLAFAAGATDAFAFLLLGGVFTANMTGNLVLGGLTQRPGYSTMITGLVVAVLTFTAALYWAFRFANATASLRRLVLVLVVGLIAQFAVLAGWLVVSSHASPVVETVLIAPSAVAMACQTAVAKRVEGRSAVTTTYVTGTLTNLMSDFADRKPQNLFLRLGVIAVLVVGALCSSTLIGVSPALGAALPIVPAIAGAMLLATSRFNAEPSPVGG
jgi:uncharacterized membrane protein YoaK (UPF0700 family)